MPQLRRMSSATTLGGLCEIVVQDAAGQHYALFTRDRPRAGWTVDLWNDGNIPRRKKAYPKTFKSYERAFNAVWNKYLDACAGKAAPKFLCKHETNKRKD